jgi:hypothetical protein
MPAPDRNRVQVVRCKGCKRCIPISVEVTIGSVAVACPVCLARRSYIVSTEVFLGRQAWNLMIMFPPLSKRCRTRILATDGSFPRGN